MKKIKKHTRLKLKKSKKSGLFYVETLYRD